MIQWWRASFYSSQLAERVTTTIDIRSIFREPGQVAKPKLQESITVLRTWRETYFSVREKIEISGRDQRWEFDHKRLFGSTDYIATMCEDVLNIYTVIEEFNNILGPELRSVTGLSSNTDHKSSIQNMHDVTSS